MQMPLSCIAVLGAERQQILSASGVASSQPYTDRKVSFCAWLLVPEQPELLIVEDMLADSRWASPCSASGSIICQQSSVIHVWFRSNRYAKCLFCVVKCLWPKKFCL